MTEHHPVLDQLAAAFIAETKQMPAQATLMDFLMWESGKEAQLFQVLPRTLYERNEDMSPTGKLRLIVQDDGDIIVAMEGRTATDEPCFGQVEFCSIGAGGGRSPHTRNALRNLIIAIQQDNAERPIV